MANEPDALSEKKTLPIRDKTLLKRNINKHHNNNFGAGYVPVHEESLHKVGLRGRKTYAFWTLVGLLSLLAWGNMILTIVIFKVLHLGKSMESLELIPEERVVKFFGNADLGSVYKPDGDIKSFYDYSMQVRSTKGAIKMDVEDSKGRSRQTLDMENNGTHIRGVEAFKVGSAFSTESPKFKLPPGVRNAAAKVVQTGRITSPLNEKLVIRSDGYTKLKGSEGTQMEGKSILWTADQIIHLKSTNGSISLNSENGIILDVKNIPIVSSSSLNGLPLSAQYKVCVCMPQGKLFRVPVSTDYSSQIACHNIDMTDEHNPCL